MGKRRSDTRERIRETALRLFTNQGYEQTSLREIAEELGVTKAALYYHFKSKEEILASMVEDVQDTLGELVEWAESQPRTVESRKDILRRLSEVLSSKWRPLLLFAAANQRALQSLDRGEERTELAKRFLSLASPPEADSLSSFRATLAVLAIAVGNMPSRFLFDSEEDFSEIALQVAFDLISM